MFDFRDSGPLFPVLVNELKASTSGMRPIMQFSVHSKQTCISELGFLLSFLSHSVPSKQTLCPLSLSLTLSPLFPGPHLPESQALPGDVRPHCGKQASWARASLGGVMSVRS